MPSRQIIGQLYRISMMYVKYLAKFYDFITYSFWRYVIHVEF